VTSFNRFLGYQKMSFGNGGDFNRAGGPPPDPFAANDLSRPVAKKSNAIWWILGILGVLTVGGALLCCGGMFFMYSFTNQFVGEMVKATVENDPAVQEHVGSIENIEINLTETGNAGGGNKLVFDVTGDKGTGKLEVALDNSPEGQAVESCVLVLPNGDRHTVTIEAPADEPVTDEPAIEVPSEETPSSEQPLREQPLREQPAGEGATELEPTVN